MRLLFVGTSPGRGGTETHLATLAAALAAGGDDVVAVVRPGGAIEAWLQDTGVPVMPGSFRNVLDPRGTLGVVRGIRTHKPDWIVGSFSKEYWPLAVLARASGVPLALFKHLDIAMRPGTGWFIPRLASRFIVVSESMRRSFVERGVPARLLDVLPNPIDTLRFRPDPQRRERVRAELGYGPEDVVVGYLGRISPEKGVYALADALEDAMERVWSLRALWVGTGPDEPHLRERLRSSPHAARHSMRPFATDILPALAALDLLAVPSLIPESFGRVAAEAEACGVPVLASRIGGIPEAVRNGSTGLLARPGDVTEWADALVRLSGNPGERRRMAAAGPRFVAEQFDALRVAEQFRALLRRRRSPPSGRAAPGRHPQRAQTGA